jgi:hypothetical protein
MAITSTQQGVVTEGEFAKVVILTTDGALVPARPVAADDRRDYEIHIRRHFLESLAMQLKTAKRLRLHGRSRMLQRSTSGLRPRSLATNGSGIS